MNPPKFLLPPPEAVVRAAGGEDGRPEEQRALLSEEVLDETVILPADLGTSGYEAIPVASAKKPPQVCACLARGFVHLHPLLGVQLRHRSSSISI